MAKKLKIKTWPARLGIIILILTIFPWDYGFYMLSRVFIFGIAIYYAINNHSKKGKQNKNFWYFSGIAILFNPVLPIHLFYRLAWIIVDIVVIIYFYKYYKNID